MTLSAGRTSVFGIPVDGLTLYEASAVLSNWATSGSRSCRYVVTPNLDHAVQYQSSSELREAYANASLVVADGWPLVTASRLSGNPLPERVAGSDLVPALFDRLNERNGGTVFLLGAEEGVADIAARTIERRWPTMRVIGTYSPEYGFERDEIELRRIRQHINAARPDVLVVGFGAPKQEVWLRRFHHELSVGVAVAAGATIDFLAGRQKRAPRWLQRLKLEWFHRLSTNPRRLTGRYARNLVLLPQLIYREKMAQSRDEGRSIRGTPQTKVSN